MPPPCQVPIRECSGRPHLNCEIGPRLQPLAPGLYFFTPTVLPSICNELHFDNFAQEVTF